MNETNRQKKIAGVLQNDLALVLQKMLRESGQLGIIISVSKVTVTTDLSLSKVFTSVFPPEKSGLIVKELNELKPKIKHQIAQKTKNQLRKMPDLAKQIKEYQPQPNPMAEQRAQMEMQLLQAQIANESAKAAENAVDVEYKKAKTQTEISKSRNLNSKSDMEDLNFVECPECIIFFIFIS